MNHEPLIGAVDIGGTKIAVGVVTAAGQLLDWRVMPTRVELGFEKNLDDISIMLRQAAQGRPLVGIGVGCTGPVEPLAGMLGKVEFLSGWEDQNLAGGISERFDLPVFIENDADAAALGEVAWGAGVGARRFIYITVSTGIGAGLVLDGQLYRGVDGAHPEIGHMVIDPTGPVCNCGASGCWESLASGSALAQLAAPLDARQACQAAEAGDPHARAAVMRVARYLGIGVANLVTLYTPDVIALGGGLMQSRHLFWDTIKHTVRTSCGLVPHEKTRLAPAALGIHTGLVGAAQVFLFRSGFTL